MNKIIPIPAFKDNYIWAILSQDEHSVIIVDPGCAEPVIDYLKLHQLNLSALLITHHHWDHTGGIADLVKQFPTVPVYGPSNPSISHVNHRLTNGDQIHFDNFNLNFTILTIPGHTLDHIAYVSNDFLLCGDTLFSAGCGRVFEGTAEQMVESLSKLKALPDNLLVYCAHEYTEANLNFALTVLADDPTLKSKLAEVKSLRAHNKPSLPSKLAIEKKINLFLRCDAKNVAQAVKNHNFNTNIEDPISVFANLRAWKNEYS